MHSKTLNFTYLSPQHICEHLQRLDKIESKFQYGFHEILHPNLEVPTKVHKHCYNKVLSINIFISKEVKYHH